MASSMRVGGAVVVDMRGERGVTGVDAADETAVLLPLRKKLTLNPGTTMVEVDCADDAAGFSSEECGVFFDL